jgi:hypothetical protein
MILIRLSWGECESKTSYVQGPIYVKITILTKHINNIPADGYEKCIFMYIHTLLMTIWLKSSLNCSTLLIYHVKIVIAKILKCYKTALHETSNTIGQNTYLSYLIYSWHKGHSHGTCNGFSQISHTLNRLPTWLFQQLMHGCVATSI